MDKLTKEIKESKRYDYSDPIKVDEGMYQDFISHEFNGVSIGILEKDDGNFEIDICHAFENSYESGVDCKIFFDANLKYIEKLIKLFKEIRNDK